MDNEPVLLDTDTLSELSRGNAVIVERAGSYLRRFGRLTITAITVLERLRGYRAAIREGKPFERQLLAFEALVANSVVLPFDGEAASVASRIWSSATRRQRRQLGDILIAGTAIDRHLPLATRNRQDFERLTKASDLNLRLVDWFQLRAVR